MKVAFRTPLFLLSSVTSLWVSCPIALWTLTPAAVAETAPLSSTQSVLMNPVWYLHKVEYSNDETVQIQAPKQYTLAFKADGSMQLRADCNLGSGSYTHSNGQISLQVGALTRVACPPGSYADRYLRDLQNVASYILKDGKLHLSLRVDGGVLTFGASPTLPSKAAQLSMKASMAPRAIAKRYYQEILNEGKLEVIDELMTPDFLFTIPTHPEPYRGPAGFKQLVSMLHTAFPDVHLEVKQLLVDGNTVVGHWIGSGTHTGGPLHTVQGDIPASGKRFVIDGVSWLKIVDGKIVESLANEDTLSLLRQLAVLPAPPTPAASEVSRSLATTFFNDILNQGKLDLVADIIAPDFKMHVPLYPYPLQGQEALKAFVTSWRTAFPDARYTLQRDMSDDSMAAVRWTYTGTHKAKFIDIPASNKTVNLQGVSIFKTQNGKIVELWVNENALGLLEQIGGLAQPAASSPR